MWLPSQESESGNVSYFCGGTGSGAVFTRKNWVTLSASRFGKMKTTLLRDAINGATMRIDIRRTDVALIPCNRILSLM